MDVFRAHEQLIEDYDEFTRSLVWVRDPAIRAHLKEERDRKTRWPDPWISLNPMFRKGGTVAELTEPRDGEPPVLAPLCAQYFRDKQAVEDVDGREDVTLTLHYHQKQAVEIAASNSSYVLTTGTGSGKSLSYLLPIVNEVLKHPRPGTISAIIVYPMNALANSQMEELKRYLEDGVLAADRKVTFARYTGQEKLKDKQSVLASKPDILLLPRMWPRLPGRHLRQPTGTLFRPQGPRGPGGGGRRVPLRGRGKTLAQRSRRSSRPSSRQLDGDRRQGSAHRRESPQGRPSGRGLALPAFWKADHSEAVKRRGSPPGFLESRTALAPLGSSATSTQSCSAPLADAFRQIAVLRSYACNSALPVGHFRCRFSNSVILASESSTGSAVARMRSKALAKGAASSPSTYAAPLRFSRSTTGGIGRGNVVRVKPPTSPPRPRTFAPSGS